MLRERDSGRIRITASANKLQHSPCRDWFVGLQGDARIQRFIGIVVCRAPKALAVLLLTAIRAIFSSFCKSSEAKAIASPSSCCDHHLKPPWTHHCHQSGHPVTWRLVDPLQLGVFLDGLFDLGHQAAITTTQTLAQIACCWVTISRSAPQLRYVCLCNLWPRNGCWCINLHRYTHKYCTHNGP